MGKRVLILGASLTSYTGGKMRAWIAGLLLSEFWRSALALTFWLATGAETLRPLVFGGQIGAIVGLVVGILNVPALPWRAVTGDSTGTTTGTIVGGTLPA